MSEDKLDKIMKYLENLNERVSNMEDDLSTRKSKILAEQDLPKVIRGESFMEFFKKFNPKKETDTTLVIMHFLDSKKNIANITTKDIAEGFKEVRKKTPANIADKIQMLHKKAFIRPGDMVDKLKGWMITRTGLEYLEKLKNEKGKEEK